ncbi:hypothetical protein ABPG77_004312 [Micractinium sp. CCAP 211/92]
MVGLRSSRARVRQPGPRPAAHRLLAQAATVAALFAFLPLLLPLLAVSPVSRATDVTEISPTVYIGGIQDLRPDSTGPSKCSRLVDAAATYGASTFKRAQFLVSVLWWDSGPRDPPAGYNGCQNYTLSTYYCFSRFNATSLLWWSYHRDPATGTAAPVAQADIDEFRGLLTACLQHAVDQGLQPAINLHADDGRAENGWRNTLPFDPLQKFQGFSYYDILLEPIADALNAVVLQGNSEAWLSLQGEMGATVFFYPWSWVQAAEMVRDRVSNGRPDLRYRVLLGLGINNSKLCGCVLIDVVNYDDYLAAFAPLWPSIQGWFDLEGIRAAFTAADFVGISAYVPQNRTDYATCEMERLMQKMDDEFAYYNLTLRELVTDLGKQIHWIEWGIGGGISQNGDTPATTALQAAQYPFWGVWGPYNASRDPWADPGVRDYMLYYVNQTSNYLLQGGCEYVVEGCYLWTVSGSWDILGFYDQVSNPGGGSFRVEQAVDIIRRHNQLAHALGQGQAAPVSESLAAGAANPPVAQLLSGAFFAPAPRG